MHKRKKFVSLLAGIMAAVMLLSLLLSLIPAKVRAASSSEIKKQIQELKNQKGELQNQIEDLQNEFDSNEDEITQMVSQKYILDQEVYLLYEQIENMNQQLTAFGLLIADKQDELDEAQALLEDLNIKNKERIRAMEEDGTVSYWSVLFKAKSFADLLDRMNMIDEIAAADRRRLKEMSRAAEAVAHAQAELQSEKDELQLAKNELVATHESLNQKQAESQQILNDLIARGYELEDLFAKYEQEEKDLMAEIAAKEEEYNEAKYREWIAYMATYTEPTTEPPETEPPTTKPTTPPEETKPADPTEKPGEDEQNKETQPDQTEPAETQPEEGKTEETQPEDGKSEETQPEATEPEETEPPATEPTKPKVTWVVPCSYRQFSSPFGNREAPTAGASTYHEGVDLAGPEGTPIYATRSGTVTASTFGRAAGYYVTINHGDGFSSIYMHMTRYVVKKGQTVEQGQLIGYMGATGIATGSHLHFGISYKGVYVNPANYMYFHP